MAKCFVVCPIGEPNSDERKRSNGFLREVVRPVLEQAGYDVARADEDLAPGLVTEAIVRAVTEADLVVADLHGHNPNVMYEVALRHATGRPIIQMIEQGEKLPFDISGLNTIFYDPSVDGLERWREDLTKAVQSVARGEIGSNPVSRASLYRNLQRSDASERDLLSAMLNELTEVRQRTFVPNPRKVLQPSDDFRVLRTAPQVLEYEIPRALNLAAEMKGHAVMVEADLESVKVALVPHTLDGPPLLSEVYPYNPNAAYGEAERIAALFLEQVRLRADHSDGDLQRQEF